MSTPHTAHPALAWAGICCMVQANLLRVFSCAFRLPCGLGSLVLESLPSAVPAFLTSLFAPSAEEQAERPCTGSEGQAQHKAFTE